MKEHYTQYGVCPWHGSRGFIYLQPTKDICITLSLVDVLRMMEYVDPPVSFDDVEDDYDPEWDRYKNEEEG